MPNNISNRLEISGTDFQVNQIREFLKGEPFEDGSEMCIDFNKIIKRPKELDITSNGYTDAIQLLLFDTGESNDRLTVDQARDRVKKLNPIELSEYFNTVLKLQENIKNFGHCNWYKWSIENWGTKWNGYCQSSDSNNVLFFETAWSGVPELMTKLSKIFPEITLNYSCMDFDDEWVIEIKNGEILTEKREDVVMIPVTTPMSEQEQNINKVGTNEKDNNIGRVDISLRSYENLVPEPEFDEIFHDNFDFIIDEDFHQGLLVADRRKGDDFGDIFNDAEWKNKQHPNAYAAHVTFYDLQEFLKGINTYKELEYEYVYLIYNNLLVFRYSEDLLGEEFSVFDTSIEDSNHKYFKIGHDLNLSEVKSLITENLISIQYEKH